MQIFLLHMLAASVSDTTILRIERIDFTDPDGWVVAANPFVR